MPRRKNDNDIQKKNANGNINNSLTIEKNVINELTEALKETEISNNTSNGYIYNTPISFEKKRYFPPTPKKKEKDEDSYFFVKGRNLSKLFSNL